MDEMTKTKTGPTHARHLVAMKDKAFDLIRNLPILETHRAFFESAGVGRRFHERLFTADSQFRFGHELAFMVNPAQTPMAESEVQGKACHHV